MSETRTKDPSHRPARWDAGLAADAYARGLWVTTTLTDALLDAASASPERILLVDGDIRLDCRTMLDRAATLANHLQTRMPVGSVVSFMLPNWHEAAVVYLGATLAGMVVNPILPSLRDRELDYILRDAGSRMVFVPGITRGHDYAAMLTRVCAGMPDAPEVVVVRGEAGIHTAWDTLLTGTDSLDRLPTLDPDSVRMILYTSGTTGVPKGVLHSHNSIHALIAQIRDHWSVHGNDTFLVPSPIAHIGGSIYAFEIPLLLGSTAVLMERWNADDAVGLLVAERCTHMAGATPFLEQILAAAERDGTRLPHLRLFVCGGASVPPSLIRRAATYFDSAVVTRVYGSTEVPVTTVGATDPDDVDHAADTDGRTGLADIVLAPDGELRARGPQMLRGYLHPEDDADAFDDAGYFRTGDLARRVDDDYIVVTGRAKDLVIRNGENIAPKELEDLLVDHPAVAEIAIVGIPDARTGERACAVVVPATLPGPDLADLTEYLRSLGLASFKLPEQIHLWESLPKNDAGKVLKHRIRAALTDTDAIQTDSIQTDSIQTRERA